MTLSLCECLGRHAEMKFTVRQGGCSTSPGPTTQSLADRS